MKELQDKTVTTTAKQTYVKPVMEVYEMEVEQCILGDSGTGSPDDYDIGDSWSKIDTGLHDNVFNA